MRSNSPPGTGGVARRAGVVVRSKWLSLNLPPRRFYFSFSSIHSFTTSVTAQALSDGRILAMGYDFTSETSMAFHGKSDLLHHDLHV